MDQQKEKYLVEQLSHGDEASFNEIYRRYCQNVYGFAYRMTVNSAIAEEMTQETFLVLIRRPDVFRPERGSLLTFLYAVVRNLVLNHLRRKHRSDVNFEDIENFEPAANGSNGNPLAQLLNQELASRIDRCIASLPPSQREAIILREYEGLSYEEISRVTESELSAVKTRIHRARRSLSAKLSPHLALPKDSVAQEGEIL